MPGAQVLLVAGTHGNELNAPWLFDQWTKNDSFINSRGITLSRVIGNPSARILCQRYLDRDLNRSFAEELLDLTHSNEVEINRAKELLSLYGPSGKEPCQIVFDFHSTTSSMGCCLVVYGRRPADLALASLIQYRLGLPIYLHEGDQAQSGFLVEAWPCGLVIEIGPVPQGVLNTRIIHQNKLTLEICLEEISKVQQGEALFPKQVIIHRHLGSKDFPRDLAGNVNAFIHKDLQGNDWFPINSGDPLFENVLGEITSYKEDLSVVPVFINEGAYVEKNIAMSLTSKEVWPFSSEWELDLKKLILN